MDPTTIAQPGAGSASMDCPPMSHMMDGMGGCPCMQMYQMMGGSPLGWAAGIAAMVFLVAAIVALVSLSVFLIRRSRAAVAP